MSVSLYDVSIPALVRGLRNLSKILDKAEAHASEKGIDPATLTTARLFEDMRPLSAQVQLATDSAKGCVARLAGIDVPSFPDTEQTFDELRERLAKTIAFAESVDAAQFADAATRAISLPSGNGAFEFTGLSYVSTFVLPNFYFHVTTAYDILRHNGVPLGKMDYLGLR
ncbi:DUF1993 domain-containing protein [Burkholderia sp. Ac-20379]|uniref:DUF1993 domain-containing protein n=1 Tax=Burkholderia sp. Ac-20379 TaxID=2703900 RepID=UPI00197D987C|nr:DUF1993 domain-containing protein [Burkholderia sp. Ac-20379]MBN3723216.1 DUF1993 domain-containing protein [Burkholderia sp. Ac-20379]